MKLTWKKVLKRRDLIGGTIETRVDDRVERGVIIDVQKDYRSILIVVTNVAVCDDDHSWLEFHGETKYYVPYKDDSLLFMDEGVIRFLFQETIAAIYPNGTIAPMVVMVPEPIAELIRNCEISH